MVIVVPIYEEEHDRRLLQHRRRDRRRRHVPRQVPQEPHPAHGAGLLGEVLLQARQPRLSRCSRRGYAKVGVYICYDRHFPEGARAARPERRGDRLQPVGDRRRPLASICGSSSSRRTRSPTATSSARINRVGTEAPWNIGEFYGQSYFCDPRGSFLADGSRDKDELVVADLDLDMIDEVRHIWQFYRDRRPETYGADRRCSSCTT